MLFDKKGNEFKFCGHTNEEHAEQRNFQKTKARVVSDPQAYLSVGDTIAGVNVAIQVLDEIVGLGGRKLKGTLCVLDVTGMNADLFTKGSLVEAWYIGETVLDLWALFTPKGPCKHAN